MKDAPYSPIKRREWVLDKATGLQRDKAISRRCPVERRVKEMIPDDPGPLGQISERLDVIGPMRPAVSFAVDERDSRIADLIRPPQ